MAQSLTSDIQKRACTCLKQSHMSQNSIDTMQISYRILDHGAGILAQIGMASSPCILLRGDMDALPIKEESGEAFASVNGNMHACGHDLHATMLLGAAKLLKKMKMKFMVV